MFQQVSFIVLYPASKSSIKYLCKNCRRVSWRFVSTICLNISRVGFIALHLRRFQGAHWFTSEMFWNRKDLPLSRENETEKYCYRFPSITVSKKKVGQLANNYYIVLDIASPSRLYLYSRRTKRSWSTPSRASRKFLTVILNNFLNIYKFYEWKRRHGCTYVVNYMQEDIYREWKLCNYHKSLKYVFPTFGGL